MSVEREAETSESRPTIEPEIITAIGLFLIGQYREGLGRYGKIRYTPALPEEAPDENAIEHS